MNSDDFVLELTFGELAAGEKALQKQLQDERKQPEPDFAKIVMIGTALEAIRVSLAKLNPK